MICHLNAHPFVSRIKMEPCECLTDGYCRRWNREMVGRARELCSGDCPESRPCSDTLRLQHRRKWAKERLNGPSTLVKVGNLIRDTAAHLKDGTHKVPLEVYEERLSICRGCDLYENNVCNHQQCGCSMAGESRFSRALWWGSKKCPDGKWPTYVPPNSSDV